MDVERRTAEIVEFHTSGQPIHLCLTSVEDLGRFMVAAIALNPDNWPGEFRMQGDRLTVTQVIQSAESVTGGKEVVFMRYLQYTDFFQELNLLPP